MSRRGSDILRKAPFLLGVVVGALVVGSALVGLLVTGAISGSALNVSLGPRISAWVISENDPRKRESVRSASVRVNAAGTLYIETNTARIIYAGSKDNPVGFAPTSLTSPRANGLYRAARRMRLFRGPQASLAIPNNQEAVVTMQSPNVDATIRTRAAWSGVLTTARVRSGPWEQKLGEFVGRWVLITREGIVRDGEAGSSARIGLTPGQPYAIFGAATAPIVVAVNQSASLLIDAAPGTHVMRARLRLAKPLGPLRTYVGVAADNARLRADVANGVIDTAPRTGEPAGLGALFDQATYVSSSL
jgi:hypothetical protein